MLPLNAVKGPSKNHAFSGQADDSFGIHPKVTPSTGVFSTTVIWSGLREVCLTSSGTAGDLPTAPSVVLGLCWRGQADLLGSPGRLSFDHCGKRLSI